MGKDYGPYKQASLNLDECARQRGRGADPGPGAVERSIWQQPSGAPSRWKDSLVLPAEKCLRRKTLLWHS